MKRDHPPLTLILAFSRQAEIIRLAEQLKVPIHEISRISMAQTLQRKGDQGVLLSCGELRPKRIKRIERAGGAPLWLAMEDVHDPMNLGAVIRSCFYLGVQGLILTNHSWYTRTIRGERRVFSVCTVLSCSLTCLCSSLTPTVSRASSGALEFFPIFTTDNLGRFLEAQTHFTRVALSPPTQTTTDDASFESVATATAAQPTLLVLGSEGAGLSAQASAQCDAHVSLKPHGALQDTLSRAHVDSLNVSVAAAISIDRFMRVRK